MCVDVSVCVTVSVCVDVFHSTLPKPQWDFGGGSCVKSYWGGVYV